MATAGDVIKRAMRLCLIIDSGEEPTAAESSDGLTALNAMLDSWSTKNLYIYTTRQESLSWTAGAASKTIGTGGDFATTRPTRVEDSTYFSYGGFDYPLNILRTKQAYNAISLKTTQSDIPEYLYYEPGFATGTLYIWPVPSSTITLYLNSPQQLSSLASLTTTFSFPPGYEDAVTYSLARRIAPEFGVAVPPEVMDEARKATMNIKRLNTRTPVAQVEVSEIGGRGTYNVFSDS